MKFASYLEAGSARPGLVVGDELIDLGGDFPSLLALIEAGPEGPAAARGAWEGSAARRLSLGDVQLVAPLPEPRRCLFAVGLNYLDHFEEGDQKERFASGMPEYPAFFVKASGTVIGPGEDIGYDATISEQFDYEAELAVVIGTRGRDIPVASAEDHVFGYTLANDVSVRDVQRRHGGQWNKGKSFDRTCPLGPVIVTRDEIRLDELEIECEVNGEPRQRARVAQMAFGVADLVAELSVGMTLVPGDLLLTGTPAGVGYARKPPQYLKPGDEVVIRAEQIGELRNRVGESLGALFGS